MTEPELRSINAVMLATGATNIMKRPAMSTILAELMCMKWGIAVAGNMREASALLLRVWDCAGPRRRGCHLHMSGALEYMAELGV
jgi:hypothetical protein